MNGALTIGTLDGANVEIREAVGAENFFLFGLTAEEVARRCARAGYRPRDCYERDPELRAVIDAIAGRPLLARRPRAVPPARRLAARATTRTCVLADFRVLRRLPGARSSAPMRDAERWTRMSILNVARMGHFSSDRSIREYCREIWHVGPVPIELPPRQA